MACIAGSNKEMLSVRITIMLMVRMTVMYMFMLTMGMTMMVMLRQFKWRQRPWSRGAKVWTRGDDGNDLEASGLSTRSILQYSSSFCCKITTNIFMQKWFVYSENITLKFYYAHAHIKCYSKCRSKPTMSYHERTKNMILIQLSIVLII